MPAVPQIRVRVENKREGRTQSYRWSVALVTACGVRSGVSSQQAVVVSWRTDKGETLHSKRFIEGVFQKGEHF